MRLRAQTAYDTFKATSPDWTIAKELHRMPFGPRLTQAARDQWIDGLTKLGMPAGESHFALTAFSGGPVVSMPRLQRRLQGAVRDAPGLDGGFDECARARHETGYPLEAEAGGVTMTGCATLLAVVASITDGAVTDGQRPTRCRC